MVNNGRTVLLLLALIGLGFAWLEISRSGETRVSRWRSNASPAAVSASVAGPVAGLSGMAQPLGRGLPADARPQGNPLQAANTVLTQGYGVGSHAPAHVWGGIDLAIDGNGDRFADPDGSWNHPVYATHDGVVKLTPESWPGGNHIWLSNDAYRTGYAHLASFAVENGTAVRRGDLIGYVGSTGQSSGPHLHYDTWIFEDGAWVNVNPLDFGALDGVAP